MITDTYCLGEKELKLESCDSLLCNIFDPLLHFLRLKVYFFRYVWYTVNYIMCSGRCKLSRVFDILLTLHYSSMTMWYREKGICQHSKVLSAVDHCLLIQIILIFTEIGPVTITTDPKKFQYELRELYVQVRLDFNFLLGGRKTVQPPYSF